MPSSRHLIAYALAAVAAMPAAHAAPSAAGSTDFLHGSSLTATAPAAAEACQSKMASVRTQVSLSLIAHFLGRPLSIDAFRQRLQAGSGSGAVH